MNWLDRITKNKKTNEPSSASIAKERLQITITRSKNEADFPFLPKLEQDILNVVKQYIDIEKDDVNCDLSDDESSLELTVFFPSNK